MITDKERRENLQESLICAYLDALGIKGYTDWVGIAHCLAELIEPSVDRDALLKLADELDKDAEDIVSAAQNAQFTGSGPKMEEARREAYQLHRIAHRIKEALGVDDA